LFCIMIIIIDLSSALFDIKPGIKDFLEAL